MIERFNKIAASLGFLRIPFIVLGLIGLAVLISTIFGSKSHADDFFLIPSVIGILWTISGYSFIINFSNIPQRADPAWGLFKRLKRHLTRAGYWLLGMVFVGLSAGVVFTSYRMIRIWLRDYVG